MCFDVFVPFRDRVVLDNPFPFMSVLRLMKKIVRWPCQLPTNPGGSPIVFEVKNPAKKPTGQDS